MKKNRKPGKGQRPGNKHISKKQVFWGILILWCLFTLVCILRPDRVYSAKEKRTLTTFRDLSPAMILSGEMDQKAEEYVTDQLPGRDGLIRLRSSFLLLTGNRYSQGVVLGKQGQMMEPFERPKEEQTEKTVEAVRKIGEMGNAPVTVVTVPTAVGVCKTLRPAELRTDDQTLWAEEFGKMLPEGVTFLDLSEVLTETAAEGEQIYYRSDHHWRTEAALACLPPVAEALGLDPEQEALSEAYWTRAVVSEHFTGSLSAKSGYTAKGEELAIFLPRKEIAYVVTDPEKNRKRGTLYEAEELQGEDPYRVFLGGNQGEIRISTDRIGGGRLLVFKDSYFNCFLPFLVQQYEEIDIIDPRYYSGDLSEKLSGGQYDRILFFYNLNTLSGDTNLSLLL